MIHKQILVVSIKTRSKTLQDSRPTYGKIKFAPPSGNVVRAMRRTIEPEILTPRMDLEGKRPWLNGKTGP
jgi:hypothetical protein